MSLVVSNFVKAKTNHDQGFPSNIARLNVSLVNEFKLVYLRIERVIEQENFYPALY